MESIPKASSTPKIIRGRPSIRTTKLVQSPIENRLEESSNSEQGVSSDSEYLSDENDSQIKLERNQLKKRRSGARKSEDSWSYEVIQEKKQINKEKSQIHKNTCFGIIIVFVIFLVALFFVPGEQKVNGPQITFEDLEKEFSSQQNDFWLSIKVAINDIIQLKQPKSIIFLYKDVDTIKILLKKVSEYASMLICNSEKPLNIPGNYLRRKEILEDYGNFIVEVRSELQTKCVVVINNLEEVPGTSAQAFHSLCDEYNPVKENVLFLFTLKVDEFPKNNYKFVEQRLRGLWSDLHSDTFYPLYTRMSIFILPVISED